MWGTWTGQNETLVSGVVKLVRQTKGIFFIHWTQRGDGVGPNTYMSTLLFSDEVVGRCSSMWGKKPHHKLSFSNFSLVPHFVINLFWGKHIEVHVLIISNVVVVEVNMWSYRIQQRLFKRPV